MKLEKDIADSRSCGQEFPTKWGGHEATYQSIVMDIGYHGHDNSHAAWLVEADRPKDRDDIPKRKRPSSQDDPMSMDSMERVAALQESTIIQPAIYEQAGKEKPAGKGPPPSQFSAYDSRPSNRLLPNKIMHYWGSLGTRTWSRFFP